MNGTGIASGSELIFVTDSRQSADSFETFWSNASQYHITKRVVFAYCL